METSVNNPDGLREAEPPKQAEIEAAFLQADHVVMRQYLNYLSQMSIAEIRIPEVKSMVQVGEDLIERTRPLQASDQSCFFKIGKLVYDSDENNLQKENEIKNFIQRNGGSLKIPYPMARGYSDIFVLKREKMFPIARLCGVFSAMNMFAEISLPTSLVLSVERKDIVLLEDTEFQRIVAWDEEREIMEKKYLYKLRLLYENWRVKDLFIHPVKLSKWEL